MKLLININSQSSVYCVTLTYSAQRFIVCWHITWQCWIPIIPTVYFLWCNDWNTYHNKITMKSGFLMNLQGFSSPWKYNQSCLFDNQIIYLYRTFQEGNAAQSALHKKTKWSAFMSPFRTTHQPGLTHTHTSTPTFPHLKKNSGVYGSTWWLHMEPYTPQHHCWWCRHRVPLFYPPEILIILVS